MADEFMENIKRRIGVFCTSQDPGNEPMWAHYGGDHRGICIQLDTSQDGLFIMLVKKVKYTKEFPTVMLPSDHDKRFDKYLHKSWKWKYEREWRVVIFEPGLSVVLRPAAIAGVIFGARAEQDTVDAVKGLLTERVALGKPPFKLYQAKQHKDRYGVAIPELTS